MNTTQKLIAHNIICLEQGIDLLRQLDDAAYVHTQPPQYHSGIGDHLRHTLEHYTSFLDGVADGVVDYDARKRDIRIATERTYAIAVTERIIAQLRTIEADRPLTIKMDSCGDDAEPPIWSQSSVQRDLQYLQAHTIHHFALMALLARLQGYEPGEDFGVAPSTLAYRRRQLQPAD